MTRPGGTRLTGGRCGHAVANRVEAAVHPAHQRAVAVADGLGRVVGDAERGGDPQRDLGGRSPTTEFSRTSRPLRYVPRKNPSALSLEMVVRHLESPLRVRGPLGEVSYALCTPSVHECPPSKVPHAVRPRCPGRTTWHPRGFGGTPVERSGLLRRPLAGLLGRLLAGLADHVGDQCGLLGDGVGDLRDDRVDGAVDALGEVAVGLARGAGGLGRHAEAAEHAERDLGGGHHGALDGVEAGADGDQEEALLAGGLAGASAGAAFLAGAFFAAALLAGAAFWPAPSSRRSSWRWSRRHLSA